MKSYCKSPLLESYVQNQKGNQELSLAHKKVLLDQAESPCGPASCFTPASGTVRRTVNPTDV